MVDLIRSACLAHFAEVARSVGIEPTKMLRRARLPLACLNDQNMRIAVESVRRLLEASATAAGVEQFGLRMAERGGLANMGAVGLVVREQATVGAAIETLARFIHIQSEAMRLEIERWDDVITIGMLLRIGHQRAKRQSIEYAVGRLHAIIRSLFDGDWRPLEVHFVHSPPRNRRYHRHLFGCDVIFDSDRDAILCAASDMGRPIPTAEPLIASYLRSRVEAIDVRALTEYAAELGRGRPKRSPATVKMRMPGSSRRAPRRSVVPSEQMTVADVPRRPMRLAAAPAARARMRWSR